MSRALRKSLSVALVLMMALVLGACKAKEKEEPASSKTPVYDTNEYEGALLTAYKQAVVISGEQGDMEFVTNDETLYKTGDMDQMFLDDIVSVRYHMDGDKRLADEIDLVEHMETPLEFAGELVDSGNDFITLVDKSLSITFQIDSDSYIVGDLSKGDKIELTYLGDLNEYPYANVVAVVTEAEEPKTSTVHGVVSELSGRTLLLGIDSAHAYRFTVTDSTTISGVSSHAAIGDQVDITFKGRIEDQPEALSIKVVKMAQGHRYVINGKIAEVGKDSVTLETGAAKYVFGTDGNTKFYGEKPASGYRAEITYTGSLSEKPQATIIYCVKSAKDANKATAKKKDTKATSKKNSATSQKDSKKTSENADSKKTDDSAKDNQNETSSNKDEASENTAASEQQSDSKNVEGEQTPSPEPEATETEPKRVEPSPEPEQTPAPEPEQAPETETVEPEPTPEPEEEVTPEPEEEVTPEPEEEVAPEPEQEPEPEAEAEEEPEQETEAEQEAEPEAEAEPEEEVEEEAKPNPDMGVSGQGTIIKGNEDKKTVEIELKNGKKITLTFDENTKISSGYIPQKGDVVKVEYGSSSMLLKDIQLVSRAAEPDEKADAEEAEEAEQD